MSPRVSVIVPNFNHGRFLARRIDSIRDQTFDDREVILLDDGSTDGSDAQVRRYRAEPGFTVVCNERNSGSPFKQWNEGLRHASGEYVWIAESDDDADEAFLATLVDRMDRHRGVGIAYAQSWNIDEDGRVLGPNIGWTESLGDRWRHDFVSNGIDECRQSLFLKNTIPNASAALLRRDVVKQVGSADESMVVCGDYDLWVRMLLVSDVAFVAQPLNRFRWHPTAQRSRMRTTGVLLEEILRVRGTIADRLVPPPDVVRAASEDFVEQWFDLVRRGEVPASRCLRLVREAHGLDAAVPQMLLRYVARRAARASIRRARRSRQK